MRYSCRTGNFSEVNVVANSSNGCTMVDLAKSLESNTELLVTFTLTSDCTSSGILFYIYFESSPSSLCLR